MEAHDTLNEILVILFNDIMDLEQKALISEKFKNISINDMHIIEAIGDKEPQKMSQIAKSMKVTVGTLTTAMNSLVNKGYVIREKGQEDRRVVFISLSELGLEALKKHAKFHEDMVQTIMKSLNDTEIDVLIGALKKLSVYFKKFS
ncbi:DNA-binding MarR family transcriptional regulator [Mobilisporobacter senegalensis]|uniref:DNA-binding MarR family transcriptional regulator n=1 Tax=Mobilisporobacter senegalensis TaxID=1329262 RepID=A0A3N1X5J8_9FIRM|nr:MarR family transcriptional regulator [Mobilisporobacter senegalensis]ROR21341.1 DNA-binding MarR family transcriptional regulator [Mobilisporobacter senegalensis]